MAGRRAAVGCPSWRAATLEGAMLASSCVSKLFLWSPLSLQLTMLLIILLLLLTTTHAELLYSCSCSQIVRGRNWWSIHGSSWAGYSMMPDDSRDIVIPAASLLFASTQSTTASIDVQLTDACISANSGLPSAWSLSCVPPECCFCSERYCCRLANSVQCVTPRKRHDDERPR